MSAVRASLKQGLSKFYDPDTDRHVLEGVRRLLRTCLYMDCLLPERDLQRHSVWSVLLELYLAEREGRISHVKQMISTIGEKPATAIRTIDRMEQAGLICREPDPFDRRCVVVSLTDASRAIVISASEEFLRERLNTVEGA